MQSNSHHTHIDLSIYSNSTDYSKEWTIVYRNKTHDIFIINKETYFIVKMKDLSCKKYGITTHTVNRLLAEYVRNIYDSNEHLYKMDIQELKNLAESHFRVIREKQSELECGFVYADTDFAYFEIELPLQHLRNDLDNLRDEFGIIDADEIWDAYVPIPLEDLFDGKDSIKYESSSDISYENIDALLSVYEIESIEEESIQEEPIQAEVIKEESVQQEQEQEQKRNKIIDIDIETFNTEMNTNDIPTEEIKEHHTNFETLNERIFHLRNDIKSFSQGVSNFSQDVRILNVKLECLKEFINYHRTQHS